MGIITLADAKAQLNMTTTANDAELQTYIDAATDVVQFYCGDLVGSTYTEVYDGGDATIWLRHTPVQTVTTVTEYVGSIVYTLTNQPLGSSVDAWAYTLDDPKTGKLVRRMASGMVWRFAPGTGNITVTYTTGATIPSAVLLATKIIVQHLWETQRGAMPIPAMAEDATNTQLGAGYGLPDDALELLETVGRFPVIT